MDPVRDKTLRMSADSQASRVSNGVESMHESVLMKEVLEALAVQANDVVVDATLGGAGHFKELCSLLGEGGVIVGIDADPAAVERGREAYALDRRPERPVAHLVNDNFRNLTRILERLNIAPVDKILFDLGWSGYQISAPRGFSFSAEGGPASGGQPLLMNYSENGETAADIVNSSSEEALADIIFTYGEEHFSRSIARAIVAARAKERILTTGQLVHAIEAGVPAWYRARKINPATKTFQALRIAVNDELGALKEGLSAALGALSAGGRLAIISFHSIEDRIVKNMLRDAAHAGLGTVIKKPIASSRTEVLRNRRARSAKLRVFERVATIPHAETTDPTRTVFSYA
ncbi:MAG: 16S rRNA (cytosine(1402)-N(4))-methyltransferase RsmH [Candidatus Parcubacteria bacterium]|nr:16S rRNA (cytosine(1402)-N(4))-methyltransferase RsmH [Candidatus Parcubacteria bacterium]